MAESKSLFYYDFYFNGQFVKRFNTYRQAQKLITWSPCRTYPKDLYEIRTVLKSYPQAENPESKGV